jgi:hypothetical protein
VNVKAEAGAHVAQACEHSGLGTNKVLIGRKLSIAGFTLEGGYREPRPFGDLGIIGKIVEARRLGATMGTEQRAKIKRLRRLNEAQLRTIHRAGHAPRGIDRLDGIGNGENWYRSSSFRPGVDRSGDQRFGRERSGGIVHQHEVWPKRLKGLETGTYRALPRGIPVHRVEKLQAFARLFEPGPIVGVNDRLYGVDAGVGSEGRKACPDHGLSEEVPILLGHPRARAYATASRHDHRCNPVYHTA